MGNHQKRAVFLSRGQVDPTSQGDGGEVIVQVEVGVGAVYLVAVPADEGGEVHGLGGEALLGAVVHGVYRIGARGEGDIGGLPLGT